MASSALEALPYRLLLQICQSLNYFTILKLSQVSKSLRRMTQEQDLDAIMFRNTPGTKVPQPENIVDLTTFKRHPLFRSISFKGGDFEQEVEELTLDVYKRISFLDCGAIDEMAVWPPVTSLRLDMIRYNEILDSMLETVQRESGVRVIDVVKLMISTENALVDDYGPELGYEHHFFEGFESTSYQDGVLHLVACWGS